MVDFSSIKEIEIPEGKVKSILRNGTILWKLNEGGLPSEYQEVDYIQSSGTQYINTNVISSRKVEVDFDFEFVSLNNQYNRIFGTTYITGSQYGVRSSSTNSGTFHGELPATASGEEIDTNVSININTRYKIKFNKDFDFIIDNVNSGTFPSYTRVGSQTIFLFKQNTNSSSITGASIKLYSCQIYDNNELVRDYVPCYRKSDNVAGLYDLKNGVFYTNEGTGTFTVGSNTVLLLHCENYEDSSLYNKVMSSYNNTIDNNGKFDKCFSFSGSQRISYNNDSDFRFGTGDFTIDFWLYSTVNWSSQPASCGIVGQKQNDNTNGWVFYRDGGYPTKINARLGLQNNFPTNSSPIANTWEHWAFVRKNGTIMWFKNGILDATGTNNVDINDTSGTFYIGFSQTWSGYFKGKIDELRISNVARWDSNFTPPDRPYDI